MFLKDQFFACNQIRLKRPGDAGQCCRCEATSVQKCENIDKGSIMGVREEVGWGDAPAFQINN